MIGQSCYIPNFKAVDPTQAECIRPLFTNSVTYIASVFPIDQ